jgi:hypothetical protein
MRSDDSAGPLWYYTLQLNYWLNRMRPLEMLTYQGRRREACIIYDYTIWCGGRAVAAWSGTESEAFGAMVHLAARAEREAALLPLQRESGAVPFATARQRVKPARHVRAAPGTR